MLVFVNYLQGGNRLFYNEHKLSLDALMLNWTYIFKYINKYI